MCTHSGATSTGKMRLVVYVVVVAILPIVFSAKHPPHILAILADDYGWADAGWHRPKGYKEVQTPNLDQLVANGIELNRHYAFKFCAPSRSAIQSGRNPIHVNTLNLDPLNYNPKDPVSGMASIPTNMTGIAEVLRDKAGYKTAFYGKWDCGMATMRHTPRGRGYDKALSYFHHMEDYWQNWFENSNGDTNFFAECKAKYPDVRPRDLWLANTTYEGPASSGGYINTSSSCSVGTFDLCHKSDSCHPYPGFGESAQLPGCTYVDETFATAAVETILHHDPDESPLFLFWATHIVHTPLQVPKAYYDRFAFIDDWRRRRYHAMVNYLDDKVGRALQMQRRNHHPHAHTPKNCPHSDP